MGEEREVNFYITTQPRRYVKKVDQPSKLGALSQNCDRCSLRHMMAINHQNWKRARVPRFQELEIKRKQEKNGGKDRRRCDLSCGEPNDSNG